MRFNTSLSTLALGAAVVAAPAMAEFRFEGANGSSVTLYGQINPAYSSVDDGTDTYGNLVDSSTSGSRVGLRYNLPIEDMTFQFRFETALGLPASGEFDQNGSTGVDGWSRTDLRHIDFSLAGDWGKVSAGQGSMAADGASTIAVSAVGAVLYQFTGDGNGLYQFRTDAGALSGNTIEDTFGDFGGSRRFRVRYDTPEFNGFSVAVAYGYNILDENADEDYYADIALNYANEFANGVEVLAAVAYQQRDRHQSEDTSSFVASGGVMLPNGLSVSAGYGSQTDDRAGRTDPNWYYAQVAYDKDFFGIGTTSFGIDYYEGSDFNSEGSTSKAMGVGVLQKYKIGGNLDAEAYLTYRVHEFDEVATNYQDVNSVLVGTRIRF